MTIDTIPTDRMTLIPHRLRNLAALERELDDLTDFGTADTLERIRRLTTHSSPGLAGRARFAEALVGHRLGADYGVELEDLDFDPLPARFRIPLEIRPAPIEDRRQLWTALAGGSYGIAPALRHTVRLDFDEEAWLIVPDGRFCYRETVERLRTTRSLLGLVADRSADGFLPAFLILTTPRRDQEGALVHVHDSDGAMVYGGRLQVEDGEARFTIGVLRTRTQAEAATPLEIEVRLGEDGLHVSEASGAVVATPPDLLKTVKAASASGG